MIHCKALESRVPRGTLLTPKSEQVFVLTVTVKEMKTVVEDVEPLELAADEDVEQQQDSGRKRVTKTFYIRWNNFLFPSISRTSTKIHIFFTIRIVIHNLNNLFVHRNNI